MRFRLTGKQAVQFAGCLMFCLVICVLAFWNRSLVIEPVSEYFSGRVGFREMKSAVQANYLSDRLRGKSELLTLNGGYARLEGRQVYNKTVRMTNDMLTSVTSSLMDTTEFADNLERFSRYLEGKDIPFLFIMAPYKVPTGENLLPAGIEDMTNAIADQVITELNERNVPVLDLRPEMSSTRSQVDKYFYHTDHHWNVEGSFFAYQEIVKAVQNRFPDTKTTFVDQELWEKTVIPNWWLGTHGKRVGPLFGGTDDLDYYLPKFETAMSRYSLNVWAAKGDFRKVSIREWFLDHSDYFHLDNYQRYLGGGFPLTLHCNPEAENERKLLLLRDSYMLPVECFLSTEFTCIDVIDPRDYDKMSEMDYVALNSPEMVILMIYPGIFPSGYYQSFINFGEEKSLEVVGESTWKEQIASSPAGKYGYEVLPVSLYSGESCILSLDGIQINAGNPDGANIMLYDGDRLLDQTIFDIDCGKKTGFHWGFLIPESDENDHDYQLRFYAGVSGDTEGVELIYQGIRLQECLLTKQ